MWRKLTRGTVDARFGEVDSPIGVGEVALTIDGSRPGNGAQAAAFWKLGLSEKKFDEVEQDDNDCDAEDGSDVDDELEILNFDVPVEGGGDVAKKVSNSCTVKK